MSVAALPSGVEPATAVRALFEVVRTASAAGPPPAPPARHDTFPRSYVRLAATHGRLPHGTQLLYDTRYDPADVAVARGAHRPAPPGLEEIRGALLWLGATGRVPSDAWTPAVAEVVIAALVTPRAEAHGWVAPFCALLDAAAGHRVEPFGASAAPAFCAVAQGLLYAVLLTQDVAPTFSQLNLEACRSPAGRRAVRTLVRLLDLTGCPADVIGCELGLHALCRLNVFDLCDGGIARSAAVDAHRIAVARAGREAQTAQREVWETDDESDASGDSGSTMRAPKRRRVGST